jgi:hypothetical protein
MRERNKLPGERFLAILPEDCRSIMHYMRPQFRFLCILAAVGCCCILDDGLALSFIVTSAIFIV